MCDQGDPLTSSERLSMIQQEPQSCLEEAPSLTQPDPLHGAERKHWGETLNITSFYLKCVIALCFCVVYIFVHCGLIIKAEGWVIFIEDDERWHYSEREVCLSWYYQVQMQMAITKIHKCIVIIFTANHDVYECSIDFDNQFWESLQDKLF